jgi:hypothetical protein
VFVFFRPHGVIFVLIYLLNWSSYSFEMIIQLSYILINCVLLVVLLATLMWILASQM